MYNVDLVRNLCKTITREKDARKSAELLALLRAVMREDAEEIRVRMAFLAKNYSLLSHFGCLVLRTISDGLTSTGDIE
jgi:hypothetical protein